MCMYNKEMSWFRNTITDLYNAVSAPVAATRDVLASILESVRETASLLYERAKQKLGYGQLLKDIVEEQANQDYIGIEDIKMIALNEPLMDCGLLPKWLRKKRCINALATFDDNLCVWRCLALYKRKDVKRGAERSTKEALNLARAFYSDNKLKRKDVRATRLENFEGIPKHLNVNIMLYESEKESGEDVGKIWRVVYGKTQYKDTPPTINMGLFQGHCFYINKIAVLCQNWECKGCKQIFKKSCNLTRHLKEDRCKGGKTKLICYAF